MANKFQTHLCEIKAEVSIPRYLFFQVMDLALFLNVTRTKVYPAAVSYHIRLTAM